jgi:alpha-D-xyloside xylohydrolase
MHLKTVKLYLPAGTNWYDFYTNKLYAGGQTITAAAPISNIPVFVKEGAMIVTGAIMQYSTEKKADTLTVTVYGKKDAAFNLYEDENENYNYESGKYANIELAYNGANNSLTINDRIGNFEGMLSSRVFKIVLIDKNTPPAETIITYNGNKITVQLAK